MLPKNLQRFTKDGASICPSYIKATDGILALAEELINTYTESVGDSYEFLLDTYEGLCAESQRHRLIRSFIHILDQRLTFDEKLPFAPSDLRNFLFTEAGKVGEKAFQKEGWQDEIIEKAATKFACSNISIRNSLYIDLKERRRILAFESLDADELIAIYNLSLAQSLLLSAKKLSFSIRLEANQSQALRRLFQRLRFFNLLFDVKKITDNTWQFEVDGPSALLPQAQKYALQLAMFLPTLYAFDNWRASADILNPNKGIWQLKPDDFTPPTRHFPERLRTDTENLAKRIQELDPSWEILDEQVILNLGPQSIWVPDISLKCRENGAIAHIEVLGFWRADYLNRRLKALEKAPKNLILVLSEKLKIDKAKLHNSKVKIVTYNRTPLPKKVLDAVKQCSEKDI